MRDRCIVRMVLCYTRMNTMEYMCAAYHYYSLMFYTYIPRRQLINQNECVIKITITIIVNVSAITTAFIYKSRPAKWHCYTR